MHAYNRPGWPAKNLDVEAPVPLRKDDWIKDGDLHAWDKQIIEDNSMDNMHRSQIDASLILAVTGPIDGDDQPGLRSTQDMQ